MSIKQNYSASFKLKVAIEVIKGDLTITEIISKYQVSKSAIYKWRDQLLNNAAQCFEQSSVIKKDEPETDVKALHNLIGMLKVENDFLSRAYAKLQ